ncbi:MAG: hypothetical protein IKA47_01080 [Oscillospiraceae bacterium]|nr:hypothetical protein [Oscillospiraceae bacterium]
MSNALTGAPGLPFPANGSKAVRLGQGYRALHRPALLWVSYRKRVSFSQPFTRQNIAQIFFCVNPPEKACQVEENTQKFRENRVQMGKKPQPEAKNFVRNITFCIM